jgi:four helix bundle protein
MPTTPEPFHERGLRFACDVVRLYVALRAIPTVPDFMARQFVRAGTSVGAHLEEARAAQSRRDAATKFSIALKEAREASYWLRLMAATNLVPAATVSSVLREAEELVAVLTVARRRLNAPAGAGSDLPKRSLERVSEKPGDRMPKAT